MQTLSDVVDRLEAYRAELAPHDFLKQGFGDRFADAYGATVQLLMRRDRPAEALDGRRAGAFPGLRGPARLASLARGRGDRAASGAWSLGGPAAPPPVSEVRCRQRARLVRARQPGAGGVGQTSGDDADRLLDSRPRLVRLGRARRRRDPRGHARDDAGRRCSARAGAPPTTSRTSTIQRSSSGQATAVVGTRDAYRTLHQLVWAPLARWLPTEPDARITIVPHGPLFALPFGALLDGTGSVRCRALRAALCSQRRRAGRGRRCPA